MNKEQALEVKDILLQIHGSIPANYVDRIFHYYRSFVDPNMVKPCTCQPKYWNQMLAGLRDKVELTLASYAKQEEIQSQEKEQEIRLGTDSGNNGTNKSRKSKTISS